MIARTTARRRRQQVPSPACRLHAGGRTWIPLRLRLKETIPSRGWKESPIPLLKKQSQLALP